MNNKTFHHKINELCDRALRLVYCDRQSTYEELLDKDNSFIIHRRNRQLLATEAATQRRS